MTSDNVFVAFLRVFQRPAGISVCLSHQECLTAVTGQGSSASSSSPTVRQEGQSRNETDQRSGAGELTVSLLGTGVCLGRRNETSEERDETHLVAPTSCVLAELPLPQQSLALKFGVAARRHIRNDLGRRGREGRAFSLRALYSL